LIWFEPNRAHHYSYDKEAIEASFCYTTKMAEQISAESEEVKQSFIRSARNLESYKRVFGKDFGMHEETILDVGAGDETMADEIEALTDHKANVIRFDRDYGNTPPEGEAPAVAGDATNMPFANDSIDRIVSHNMMYYLGRDKGSEAISEMLRVLKTNGEAMIYPANPLQKDTSTSHKERHVPIIFPTLVITKPADFDNWDEKRKEQAYQDISRAVTVGEISTNLIHWGIAKAIQRKGTNRTIELGSSSSL